MMEPVTDWSQYPNFSRIEFAHGGPEMRKVFMDKLQLARTMCRSMAKEAGLPDIPFIINSGSRSPERNLQAGGKPDSTHLYGEAGDIKATDSRSRFFILKSLILAGFTRIGVASTFIHVDVSEDKDPLVIFTY